MDGFRAKRSLPMGLAGMLVLLVVVESRITRNRLDFASTGPDFEWREASRAASGDAAGRQVLCYGDSLVKMGVAPRVIERRINRTAYNLGIGGGQAPATFYLFRQALAAGARPTAVIVDFKWTALAQDSWKTARLLPELVGLWECCEVAWIARDPDLFGALALSEAFTSVRCRHEIRGGVIKALDGKSSSIRKLVARYERNWRRNQGAQLYAKNYAGVAVDVRDDELFPSHWASDSTNRAYALRFLRLARANRIPVFLVITPIHPTAQARRDQLGADAAYTRFLWDLHARCPGVVVLDGRRSGFDASLFIDETHLDREGAAQFSDEVANLVAQSLSAREFQGRWVDMPRFRSRPIDVAIEDLEQSRIAVERELEIARASGHGGELRR
jgi:hypothetical protein